MLIKRTLLFIILSIFNFTFNYSRAFTMHTNYPHMAFGDNFHFQCNYDFNYSFQRTKLLFRPDIELPGELGPPPSYTAVTTIIERNHIL